MSIYNIHFCKKTELVKLQHFIDNHWRKGHVMGTSKELFEFQHDHNGVDYYDFAVAENKETGEFDAIYGFIRDWKYDTTKTIPNIGWGAIWKVRGDVINSEIESVAMKLMKYIIVNGDIDILASLGISNSFKQIASSLHFTVGEMNQYYIANNRMNTFEVISHPELQPEKNDAQYDINDIDNLEEIEGIDNTLNPNKNLVYFINRYLRHPFFKYRFWGVYDKSKLKVVFVVRKINVGNSYIYRIIDALGTTSLNKSIFNAIQNILYTENAEYIDCMNVGIDKSVFLTLGFIEINRNITIIPEHLNPLEQKYVPLEYAYSDDEPIVIFKGDGDQDRPNSQSELCQKN